MPSDDKVATQELVTAIVDDKILSNEQLESIKDGVPSDSYTRSLITTAVSATKENLDSTYRVQAGRVLVNLSHCADVAPLLVDADVPDAITTLATDVPHARPLLAELAQHLPTDTVMDTLVAANNPLAAAALLHCKETKLRDYAARTLYRLAASAAGAVRIMESSGDLLRSAVRHRPEFDVLMVVAHLVSSSAGNKVIDADWLQLIVDTLASHIPISATIQQAFLQAVAAADPSVLPRHTLCMLVPMLIRPDLCRIVSDTVDKLLPSADDIETSMVAWCNQCLIEAITSFSPSSTTENSNGSSSSSLSSSSTNNNNNNNNKNQRSDTRKESVRFRLTVPWSSVLAQPNAQRAAAVLALSTQDPYLPVLSAVRRFPKEAMERVPQGVVVSGGEKAAVWVHGSALHVDVCVRDGAAPTEDAVVRAVLEGEGWTARRGPGSGCVWGWIGDALSS